MTLDRGLVQPAAAVRRPKEWYGFWDGFRDKPSRAYFLEKSLDFPGNSR